MNGSTTDAWTVSFADGIFLDHVGDTFYLTLPQARFCLGHLPPEVAGALDQLHGTGVPRRAYFNAGVRSGDVHVAARLHYELARLERYGLVKYASHYGGRPLATLTPSSPGFQFQDPAPKSQAWQMSRFACWRAENGDMILETPRGHARVTLRVPQAWAVVAALAQPHDMDALTLLAQEHLPGMSENELRSFLALLEMSGGVVPINAHGEVDEETDPALRMWSFHDLLFHTRTRVGRHYRPVGDTYPLAGKISPLPAVKQPATTHSIALDRPDIHRLETLDPPFTRVLEGRQSLRAYGASPITLEQLGQFLYRSVRVKEQYEAAVPASRLRAGSPRITFELSRRPSAGGGAMHELEVYLGVHRCQGLQPGLYHYDPADHRLAQITPGSDALHTLIQDAVRAAQVPSEAQILIILASRFGRLGWKYESIPYALTLKNAGALIQTMYLVATAMDLASTAIGCGNSDLFSQVAGTNYYAETSVAEFLLGSRAT